MTVENKDPAAPDLSKLLGELETLSKSMPAPGAEGEGEGDAKIAAAAAEGEGEPDADGKKVDADGKPLTKSLQVTLPDGTVMEAEDGTELIKSLVGRMDETDTIMAKALGVAVDMLKSCGEQLSTQGKLVKSLQDKVAELGNQGRGTKSAMVTLHEKLGTGTPMTKSEPAGMDGKEFMSKAMAAMTAGKIGGMDISIAEASLNRGQPVPEHIVARVLS